MLISGMATDITVELIILRKHCTMNGERSTTAATPPSLPHSESTIDNKSTSSSSRRPRHDTRLLYYFNGCVIIPKLRSLISRTTIPTKLSFYRTAPW